MNLLNSIKTHKYRDRDNYQNDSKYLDLETLNHRLEAVFGFHEDDLTLNRQGLLSTFQIENLKKNPAFKIKVNLVFFLVLVIGGILWSFWQGTISFEKRIFALIPLLLGFALLTFFFSSAYQLIALKKGKIKVKLAQGNTTCFNDPGVLRGRTSFFLKATSFISKERIHTYVVKVRNKRFYVSKEVSEAFKNDQKYKVYYIKTNSVLFREIIISAEVI